MYEDDESPFLYGASHRDETLLGEVTSVPTARILVQHLGSLRTIGTADLATLMATGIKKQQADRLLAVFELGRRVSARPSARLVKGPGDAATVLVPRFQKAQTEEVHVLYLDSRSRLIRAQCLACGGQDRALFDVREILGGALRMRAGALVVAHNHPSGDLDPSSEDIVATRRLFDSACVLGLRLVDHLIVCGEEWSSLALKGHLPSAEAIGPVLAVGVGTGPYSMPQRRSL